MAETLKKTYTLTLKIPEKWVTDVDDLKELLERECNIWSVTHCDPDLGITEIK